ncbi:MAG: hypothetical protein J2P15_12890, partial [Micromonosporaceae bacterium]|nr:hypothetical protein [Micromonosporaceae bacterium]
PVPARAAQPPGSLPPASAPVPAQPYSAGEFYLPPESAPEDVDRSGGRVAVLLIFGLVGALLIGTLALAGTWIYRHQRPTATASPGPAAPNPGNALPSTTGLLPSPQAGTNGKPDPAVAPVIVSVVVSGDTVVVRWRDVTNGQVAQFVVEQVLAPNKVKLINPPHDGKSTVASLPGLAPPYCFVVVAIVNLAHVGASGQLCATSGG